MSEIDETAQAWLIGACQQQRLHAGGFSRQTEERDIVRSTFVVKRAAVAQYS